MSDVLKKYSIVIGADTKELMIELNKAEKELSKKLDNKDLGAGVRESIEKLIKEIGVMRSELKTATKDINNSITAINTDSLKNEFSGLQKIISADIQALQTKIEGLQGTIDILNGSDFSKLESGLGKTLSVVGEKMDNIMGEFKAFHDFTQDLRVGAIDTSALDKSLKRNEVTLNKASESMKKEFSSLLNRLDTDAVSDIRINGVDESNIKDAEHYLSIMLEIQNIMNQMDSESILSALNENNIGIDSESLKKQSKTLRSSIDNFYSDIRDEVQGKSPDIYIRWKTEINPDETAQDIINKIDNEYTDKVQEHLDNKPLKFKTEIDSKDFDDVVRNAIKEENNLLKADTAPKIKVGLEIDEFDKSNLEKVSDDLSKKVNDNQPNELNLGGGNFNLSSDYLAQESTLGEIRDILSGWNGSGIPGTQSKEQIQQNHRTESNIKNAGYLLHTKFNGRASSREFDFAKFRKQLLDDYEFLNGQLIQLKKLRRIGNKRLINNPDLLKKSELYNASYEVDGTEYAKWGNDVITLEDWQTQLDEVLKDGINDYFKNAVKSIERQLKSKAETLSLHGVEFDKDGKILARNTVAIGENEVYKAAYGQVSSLKNRTLKGTINKDGVVENSLQEEKDKLELLKLQRTIMQQIVELSNKQSSVELSKEEEEKLNALKEQLRTITQICSDEVKFNMLLKEESELQNKMNSGKLDSKGFDRLMSIRQEMSTMWEDVSDDMVEYSKQALSSTDTQLSQIDNDIAQQQTKVNKLISNYRKEVSQIQNSIFGNEIRDDKDYERRLKEWKSQSQELAVLQNSITKVDKTGNISYDMSALTESERERYYHLKNSVSKTSEQLYLYRKLQNAHSEVTGESKKENEIVVQRNKNLSETKKLLNSIYAVGGNNLTEGENLSLMSVEELQDLSNKLGNIVDSASTNMDDKLEQKARQYIDDRIKFLENQLTYSNQRIKEIKKQKPDADTSYWENKKANLENDISILKATQNQSRTEKDIIEDIKTQNKLNDESLSKVREILTLTVEIEKSHQRTAQLDSIIDKDGEGRDLEIAKRRANQERIKENENLKSLSAQRENLFNNLSLNNNDIVPILSNLLENGLDNVPSSLITEFINKVLSNALADNTVNNVKSTEVTRQSDAQMAASTKKRVDAVLEEKRLQQEVSFEAKKTTEELQKQRQKIRENVALKKEAIKIKEQEKILHDEILAKKYEAVKTDAASNNIQKNNLDNSKYYKGMTEGEAELAKQLFDENGKLFELKKKNVGHSKEEIKNQEEIVKKLQKQVQQSERLELYNSSRNVRNARLRSDYKDSNIPSSPSIPSSPNLPATEKTLVEIKNILSNKLDIKSSDASKPSSKDTKGIFNTKGYQEVAKSLGLLQKAKNGNSFVQKKDRDKVYAEMDRLGIARFIEEDTTATKKNIQAKKESKKAVDNDTAATKKNVSEKSKNSKTKTPKDVKTNISSPIKDTFQGDATQLAKTYSKDTLQKFIDGAKAETPEMEKAFIELAKIPEETVRQALQINSPSEVMKKLGFWTIEGLAIGITENADKVREAIENAVKNGTVSVDELDELSDYTKNRQRNASYKNIHQSIKNLNIKDLLISQVNDSQTIMQNLLETSNKALSESGLSSMFYVDGKAKNQKDVAQYIKENTEEVRVALEEYIRIFKENGLDANKTIDDVFADIFGDKHKTVSNAYASAINKLTENTEKSAKTSNNSANDKTKKEIQKTFNEYETSLKKLNEVTIKIENGKFTNKNLQERVILTKQIADLEREINEYRKQGITIEQAGFDIQEKLNNISEKKEVYKNNLLNTKLKSFDISLAELQNSPAPNQAYVQYVNQLASSLTRLHDLSNQPVLNIEEISEADKLYNSVRRTIDELNNLNGKEITNLIDQDSVKQFLESTQGIQKETIQVYNNGTKITGVVKEANGVSRTLEYTWNNVLGCFTKSTSSLTNQISLWTALGSQIKKSWNYLKSYFSGYMVAQKVFSGLRTGFNYIKELDSAMTEMKKVSDESISSLKEFQKESFETAKSIGATAVEIQNSAADFMRLGYSLQESTSLAKDANIYANVGDMEIDEATEHMISSIQAWQSEFSSATEASTALIDKYNEIGNNYAITSADIGSAMERSAAALKVAGNTLDESIGLITAGNLIQQDADTTANALKVMSLRIRGSKTELEEMGEETDNLASSSSKLREELKALTGVDIMLDDKTYKSTADIIQEIGAVWDKLDNVSQANTLEKLAGKTRASTVAGLIENYETIAKVEEDAAKAQGSALKENLEYMDSIEGRTAQFTTEIQKFWDTIIDSDTVKNGITLLTELLGLATDFVDKFGVLGTLAGGVGLFAGVKNVGIGMLVAY